MSVFVNSLNTTSYIQICVGGKKSPSASFASPQEIKKRSLLNFAVALEKTPEKLPDSEVSGLP
jgi:hypothetical protein